MSLQVEGSVYVRWAIYIDNTRPNSPDFRFRDAEFCLFCSKKDGDINLRLWPGEKDKDITHWTSPFNVIVQVESGVTKRILPELCQRTDDVSLDSVIWKGRVEDVIRCDPDFESSHLMTFLLKFEETELRTNQKSAQTNLYLNPNPCLESLSEDFEKLLAADSNPDAELHCEGHITRVQKSLLCSRSPVLASMLQSDMVEGKTGVVKIRDMDVDIFKQFVRYLYTGKLKEMTVDSAICLYKAGDMYSVQCLTRRCSEFLIKNLTVENACEVLAFADFHSDLEFVEAVTAYIQGNENLQSHEIETVSCSQNAQTD